MFAFAGCDESQYGMNNIIEVEGLYLVLSDLITMSNGNIVYGIAESLTY